jgi:hypothetical protein
MNAYFSSILWTVVALGSMFLLMRWTFGRSRTSLMARRPRRGTPEDYGLLVAVAEPPDLAGARRTAERLAAARIRCTLVPTTEGPRVMVWPDDEERARAVLGEAAPGEDGGSAG